MVKISKAPSGFYSARQAMRRLGMNKGTFFYHVKVGKIKKIPPPKGGTEGYYSRKEIDELAQARELFTLQYSVEPKTYQLAKTEEDIHGIVDLCIAIYGNGGTPSFEARREIWKQFPESYYIVKQEGIVVGYISLCWFNETAIEHLMGPTPKHSQVTSAGTGIYSVTGPENMIPFQLGKPIESLFISLGVRPGLIPAQQRKYGFVLLRDTLDVLRDLARRGMPVHKIYATSERQDGVKLARDLGMQEIHYPSDINIRFELDLETAEAPIAKDYQNLVKELENQPA